MGIFGFLKPKDVLPIRHQTLGVISWSAVDREYVGTFNGWKFTLHNSRKPELPGDLLAYAEHVLNSPAILSDNLEEEKRNWIAKYPAEAKEIEQLRFDVVDFYWYKGGGRILAYLEPEIDRLWRIEFEGEACKGLGFDS